MARINPPNLERAHQPWRKSNRSLPANDCVEAADLTDTIGIRDSKDLAGRVLALTPARWRTLLVLIKEGDYDLR